MSGLRTGFKEWAVICRALAEGRQTILLRKGGIAEPGGTFRVEHNRFWLWPTYVHQQQTGIIEAYHELLQQVRAEQPPEGIVRLSHFAEVVRVDRCERLDQALALEGQHGWSKATVEARYHYREPGLYVLTVRVYRIGTPIELRHTPYHLGCKSWVELAEELPTEPAQPVLSYDIFTERCRPLDGLLCKPERLCE